jgi:ligand-binding sensor domain-containing protein
MLSTFKGDRFSELTNGAAVPDCPIQQMCRSADGALWIASAGEGVLRIHEGKVRRYTKSSGLADNKVASLLHDREGNVWVGTWSGLCMAVGPQNLIVVEAENFDANVPQGGKSWVFSSRPGGVGPISGSGYMQALPESGAAVNEPSHVLNRRGLITA